MSAAQSNKKMNYGDAQALKVLVGSMLGIYAGATDAAERHLQGEPVQPMFMSEVDKKASEIHNIIAKDHKLISKANEAGKTIAASYGFTW